LIAGAGSVVFGVVYLVLATADRLSLRMLAAYALGGGLEFVIQVWLIARRRHRFATMPALS
jgi:ABC-type thiamin/hydroxymethylpyrimidine transport system permease subunit